MAGEQGASNRREPGGRGRAGPAVTYGRLSFLAGWGVVADGRRGTGAGFTGELDWFLVNKGGGPATGRGQARTPASPLAQTTPVARRFLSSLTRPQGKEID